MARKLIDRIDRLETSADQSRSYVIERVIVGAEGQPARLYSRTTIMPGQPPQVERFDITDMERPNDDRP